MCFIRIFFREKPEVENQIGFTLIVVNFDIIHNLQIITLGINS